MFRLLTFCAKTSIFSGNPVLHQNRSRANLRIFFYIDLSNLYQGLGFLSQYFVYTDVFLPYCFCFVLFTVFFLYSYCFCAVFVSLCWLCNRHLCCKACTLLLTTELKWTALLKLSRVGALCGIVLSCWRITRCAIPFDGAAKAASTATRKWKWLFVNVCECKRPSWTVTLFVKSCHACFRVINVFRYYAANNDSSVE